MTTPLEHFAKLSKIKEDGIILTMSPGPFEIAVGKGDGLAGELLEWLYERVPDKFTTQELMDVLESAMWWAMFFSAMTKAEELRDAMKEVIG
jgi:hypothetical protein